MSSRDAEPPFSSCRSIVRFDSHADGHGFLLLRRHRYTGTVSYFLCWSPRLVPLARLIAVAVTRWRIEEDHQLSKQVAGLDSGQVTSWTLEAYRFRRHFYYATRAILVSTPNSYSEGVRYPSPF